MRSVLAVAGVFVLLGAAVFFSAPERAAAGDSLEGLTLPTLAGEPAPLAPCSTEKCLTIYLSPWCGVCRSSTGMIKELRPWLEQRGVTARIVIGKDRPDAVTAYASEFGPDTWLDPSGRFPLAGGVPQFVVSLPGGRILRRQPGVPQIIQPPVPEGYFRFLATNLGLIE